MEAQAGGLCDLEGNPEGKRGELSRPGGGGGADVGTSCDTGRHLHSL